MASKEGVTCKNNNNNTDVPTTMGFNLNNKSVVWCGRSNARKRRVSMSWCRVESSQTRMYSFFSISRLLSTVQLRKSERLTTTGVSNIRNIKKNPLHTKWSAHLILIIINPTEGLIEFFRKRAVKSKKKKKRDGYYYRNTAINQH